MCVRACVHACVCIIHKACSLFKHIKIFDMNRNLSIKSYFSHAQMKKNEY